MLAIGAVTLRSPAANLFGGSAGSERIVTGIGQRRTIRLDDGSRIDLGVATTLVHPRELASDRRAVTLSGAAYFTIAADSTRPFIVTAPYSAISTRGASLAVRAYPAQSETRVVVAEGSVRIRSVSAPDSGGTVLDSGQLGRITRAGRVTTQNMVDVDRRRVRLAGAGGNVPAGAIERGSPTSRVTLRLAPGRAPKGSAHPWSGDWSRAIHR